MKFAIRDDDTNYFTKPEDLENIYGRVWSTVPISLAVVPFIHSKSDALPPNKREGNKKFPVGKNKKLVKFIKKKIKEGKVSIMLHGYSHKNYQDGFEYNIGKDLYKKTKEGKKYLEDLFGVEIKSFVPPHHSLSKEGFNAVVENGLNIVGTAGLHRRFIFNCKYIANLARVAAFRFRQGKRPVRYPHVLDFGDHKEVYCYVITPKTTFEELRNGLHFAYEKSGVFCLTGHVSNMHNKRESTKIMEDLVEESKKLEGVKYISVDDLLRSKL